MSVDERQWRLPQVMIDAAAEVLAVRTWGFESLAASEYDEQAAIRDEASAALAAALAAAPTEPAAWRRVVIDRLLPESGEERDALVEVMQDAIFEAFDVDSGAREFAFAAYDELRSVLMTEGEGPANTTEEQG